jgi:hypothetical protein
MLDYFMQIQVIIIKEDETKIIFKKIKRKLFDIRAYFDVLKHMYNFIKKIVMHYFKNYPMYNYTCVTWVVHHITASLVGQSFMAIYHFGGQIQSNTPFKRLSGGQSNTPLKKLVFLLYYTISASL